MLNKDVVRRINLLDHTEQQHRGIQRLVDEAAEMWTDAKSRCTVSAASEATADGTAEGSNIGLRRFV